MDAIIYFSRRFYLTNPPSIYLNGSKLNYVDKFTYLGHIVSSDFYDDDDLKKETRNLSARSNVLSRKFAFCNIDVKVSLFKTYNYHFYCGSLWSKYHVANFNRLRVVYNMAMRRLARVPPWHSAQEMFRNLNVANFAERMRSLCNGARERARASSNTLVEVLVNSDAAAWSDLWRRWSLLLDLQPLSDGRMDRRSAFVPELAMKHRCLCLEDCQALRAAVSSRYPDCLLNRRLDEVLLLSMQWRTHLPQKCSLLLIFG